jgi:hypothetical protein
MCPSNVMSLKKDEAIIKKMNPSSHYLIIVFIVNTFINIILSRNVHDFQFWLSYNKVTCL